MEFNVLGQLQIRSRSASYVLRRTKPKAVLALLLANANRPVSVGRLIHELWGDEPPRSATANTYTYICAIRHLVVADGCEAKLSSGSSGYTLNIDDDELDAQRQQRLADNGRAALRRGDTWRGVELLGRAVRIWRGRPLTGLTPTPALEQWIGCLEEQHRSLLRDWTDARLQLGQSDELVGELRGAVADDPLCERIHGQLILALYRAGRVGEALEAYRAARTLLADELGLDPGPSLIRMHSAILRRDISLVTDDPHAWLTHAAAA